MLPLFKKKKTTKTNNRNKKRSSGKGLDYGALENRQLLAVVTSFDAGSGSLNIDLTGERDIAVISSARGNTQLAVNAVDRFDITEVTSIRITGDADMARQRVYLMGNFSENSNAVLNSMDIGQVNEVVVRGDYYLRGDLGVRTVGLNGGFRDSMTGQLTVDGDMNVNTRQNRMWMNNGTHDFRGDVFVTTEGIFNDVYLSDINDLSLGGAVVTGDLTVNIGGDLSDADGAVIDIFRDGNFTAQNVVLGDNVDDVTNMFRTIFDTSGHFELHEDSSTTLAGNSFADTARIHSSGGLYDGFTSTLRVDGLADLSADLGIRLGDNFADLFNVGQLTFNSIEHVDIWENSDMEITGNNSARSIDIASLGNITDTEEAVIDVQNHIGIEAMNVYLGDSADDFFRSGSIYFWTPGDMNINSNDDITVIEEKNYAGALEFITTGNITDSEEAVWDVDNLARFEALNVNIGNSIIDEFRAGSVEFDVQNRFAMTENNSTLITNDNTAGESVITSFGDVENTENATVDVTLGAAFFGQTITLGIQDGDDMRFGSLNLRSPGRATVVENDDTVFGGENDVDILQMTSNGTITDGLGATIAVAKFATLSSQGITLGNDAGNEFNANAVTLDSTGDVFLNENSQMFLTGVNTGTNMVLRANGEIVDGDTSQILVDGTLDVAAQRIALGGSANDMLTLAKLTFNADDDVVITTDSSVELFGSSSSDSLLLDVAGDLTDDDLAEIVVQGLAAFTSSGDMMLGDSADDCLEAGSISSNAGGSESVTEGC